MVRWTWSYNQQLAHFTGYSEEMGFNPQPGNAIAQELLFVESSDLPLERILSEDRRQARLMALCTDAGGPEFIKLYDDIFAELEREFADRPDLRVELTGDGLMASIGINRLVHDLLYSLLLVWGDCGGQDFAAEGCAADPYCQCSQCHTLVFLHQQP